MASYFIVCTKLFWLFKWVYWAHHAKNSDSSVGILSQKIWEMCKIECATSQNL